MCLCGCIYVFQVLCCVDKQGILSWPSPNPENILFFSKVHLITRDRQTEAKGSDEEGEEITGTK